MGRLLKALTGNTQEGFILIKYGCLSVNEIKSPCNVTLKRNTTSNLIYVTSHRTETMMTNDNDLEQRRSCEMNGTFKVKIKDIRLKAFQNGSCPSVEVTACKTGCINVEFDCSISVSLNKLVSGDARTGNITLSGLSRLYSSIIWIQILQRSNNWYSINCSENTSEESTSLKGDVTNEDSAFPVALIVPVVVGIVAVLAVVLTIIYCKKMRKKPTYDGTRISNSAYDITTAEKNTLSEDPTTIARQNDGQATASAEADHYMDVADDEYNNSVNNEYNKIQFKSTPIPIDENYSHITQSNSIGNQEYDHIKGKKVIESKPYANDYGLQFTENDAFNKMKGDHDVVQQNSDIAMAYDHLGHTDKQQTQETDDQDADYSHISPKSNRPDEANDETCRDHEYFILEPTAESQNGEMVDKGGESKEKYNHQYFVLEPQGRES